jgi:hypothetical protein
VVLFAITDLTYRFFMVAPKGNKFWEIRAKHGRDRLLTDPDALREDCLGYFKWVEENPLVENKVAQFQGAPVHMPVNKMQAMTIDGLCLYLGIGYSTWRDYATREGFEDYSEVMTWAESVIRHQKFTGAAADLLNPNIIARDLGLRDKTDVDLSSRDGSMTPKPAAIISNEEIADKLREIGLGRHANQLAAKVVE